VSKTFGRDESEVYVRPFSGAGGPWQISTAGGESPAWSLKGHELFYATPDHRIVAVSYSVSGDSFHSDKPHFLSQSHFAPRVLGRSFDVHPDGDRFALARVQDNEASAKRDHIELIFGFFDEIRRIAPVGK
jgi:hypothetical protein